jgi:glycosyltransferase involved in cell wall biosynthesis
MDLTSEIIQDGGMRILLLHDPYLPVIEGAVGGEDNLAELESKTILAMGHDVVDVRYFDEGLKRKFNQVRAQTFGSPSELSDLIVRSKADVIHTHNLNQRSGYSWMASTKIPIVSSIHNYRLFCPASIAWRDGKACIECRDHTAVRALVHNCDGARGSLNASRHLVFQKKQPQINEPKLFLIASNLMENILAPLIPNSKFRILRNPGVLTEMPASQIKKREGWIFAGRFVAEKGIIDIVNNWPKTEKLDIAGDGPLKSEILQIISDKPNINLIGTYPPGKNELFLNYEGMIFGSSWFEGSPLVIVDCLGTGTPIICTDQSGAREQVELTGGGIVISGPLTVDKISKSQLQIRENFQKMSESAKHAIKNNFSVDSWGKKLEKYLLEAIE